jgi:type IV pilus assembly protein PilC
MLTFSYEARNPATGQKVKSTVQADNERAAARLIQEQGLALINIKQEQEGGTRFFGGKVKSKDKVLFARQLSTLINAGLPLVQSLRMVQKQSTSKALQGVLNEVIADVEAGQSFGKALERHPLVFSKVFTSMIAAGEVSGTLDATLDRLAMQQEKDAEIVSKIRSAMIYPAMVVFVMIAVVGFMVVKVIPQVKILYDGIKGAQLPITTRILLAVSDFTIHFWWVLAILVVLAVVFGSRWARTIGGKQVIDRLKLRMKPLSLLYQKMYMARFARTGSTLVASGVPLLQMLEITSSAINNVYITESINRAITQVKAGKSLADALDGDPNFLELVPNMLRIGEQSGSIEGMLAKTADYYEKELDEQVKAISTIIEPVLMVTLGIVALVIVSAVLLPVYSLAGKNIGG